MDIEKLLFRANSGDELKTSEIAGVVTILRGVLESPEEYRDVGPDDIYGLLLVVGRAKASEHRSLLERYLENRDPLIVSLVLEILCLQWGWLNEYLERVINFALGVSWDSDHDIRQTAVKILGFYLASSGDAKSSRKRAESTLLPQVAGLVLDTLNDASLPNWIRLTAYSSLCRAAGWSEEALPSECSLLDLSEGSEQIDSTVIVYARDLVESGDSSSSMSREASSVGSASPGTR